MLKSMQATLVATQRQVLSLASLIYDPFEMVASSVLPTKLFMPILWVQNHPWDEPLPDSLLTKWTAWANILSEISYLDFPRQSGHTITNKDVRTTVYVFSDASPAAYGAVIYFRMQRGLESPTVQVCLAKLLVAPLRTMTLPRL